MSTDKDFYTPKGSIEAIMKMLGIPKRMYAHEVARPITMQEGKEMHFLRGGDTWKLQHYVIEIPDSVLEYKENLAKIREHNGASKTAVMETQKVYLGDYLMDLGDNCIFDKYATGCGGTTLALKDDRDCIIAVPSRELVDNKRFYIQKIPVQNMIDTGKGVYRWETTINNMPVLRKDLFCIYGGLNDSLFDLEKYYQEVMSDPKRRLKIVCTYDQVGKVVGWLLGRSINYNPNNPSRPCFLYIDEMQEIYDSYQKSPDDGKDRRDAIKKMLEAINVFQHVVVISATIVAERFFFDQLLDPNRFKVYHVKFPKGSTEKICLHLRECENPRTELVAELRKYLRKDNPIPSNAHVFLNSVREILGIVKELGILENASKFKIVCSSRDEKNADKFKKAIENAIKKRYKLEKTASIQDIFQMYEGLADFYNSPIGSTIDPPHKINFYTARAFSGCDIYDEDAQPYIVTLDPKKINQVFDVSTKFKQVVGRLRNSARPPVYIYKPRGYFYDVYTNSTGDPVTDDLNDEKQINATARDILASQTKNRSITDGTPEEYLNRFGLTRDPYSKNIVPDSIIAAQNAMNRRSFRDISSYTTISAAAARENDWSVYQETIDTKPKAPANDAPVQPPTVETTDVVVTPRTRALSFKNAYLKYIQIRQSLENNVQPTQDMEATMHLYESKFPYIKDIYDLLTPEEVAKAKYSPTECKRLAAERNVEKSRPKILEELKAQISLNTFYEQKMRKAWTKYFKDKYKLSKFKLDDYGETKRVQGMRTVVKGKDLFGDVKEIERTDGFMVLRWLD